MLPNDEVRIEELELFAHIGVSEEERAQPQRLVVSLTLIPRRSFREMNDDIACTIDYSAICADLLKFVENREDCLIETLSTAMAEHILRRTEVARVEIELRKFVLPQTKFVAVRTVRSA